jgi:hypothetical protein
MLHLFPLFDWTLRDEISNCFDSYTFLRATFQRDGGRKYFAVDHSSAAILISLFFLIVSRHISSFFPFLHLVNLRVGFDHVSAQLFRASCLMIIIERDMRTATYSSISENSEYLTNLPNERANFWETIILKIMNSDAFSPAAISIDLRFRSNQRSWTGDERTPL